MSPLKKPPVRYMSGVVLFMMLVVTGSMAGNNALAEEEKFLVSETMIAELDPRLEPGDILWERRDYTFFTFVVRKFWGHSFIHIGSVEEAGRYFDTPEVNDWFRSRGYKGFMDYLAANYPDELNQWKTLDKQNRHMDVIESLTKTGVKFSSLYDAANADYVAAIRPALDKKDKASAIIRALGFLGKDYDFLFSTTDDTIYCSELVAKAFSRDHTGGGYEIPTQYMPFNFIGWSPTDLLMFFMPDDRVDPRLGSFVSFIRARHHKKDAVVSTEALLAETPYWNGLSAPGIQHQQ